MILFNWNTEKNQHLIEERGVSFERIVGAIEQGHLLDVVDHPNQDKYPGQSIYVVEIDGYVYLVPYVLGEDGERFLKTIYPESKSNEGLPGRRILMSERLDAEEREILDAFEQGSLRSRAGAEAEIEQAQRAARNTFNKTRRVNLRVTERDFELAHLKAREEGIPYQTLLSSVIHKYLSGRLTEKH